MLIVHEYKEATVSHGLLIYLYYNQRYFENDYKCECCGRECDDIDLKLEGAHNIPHVAGVQAGGCSSTKENARASCFNCNRDMKERVFDEYKESGDWKKFLT